MGLPEGHVTAIPGLSRVERLKAIGNGVCPQQAYEGLYQMWWQLISDRQVAA